MPDDLLLLTVYCLVMGVISAYVWLRHPPGKTSEQHPILMLDTERWKRVRGSLRRLSGQ